MSFMRLLDGGQQFRPLGGLEVLQPWPPSSTPALAYAALASFKCSRRPRTLKPSTISNAPKTIA